MMVESVLTSGNYEAMSFSSKDNIYELIWYYDIVLTAAEKGNEDASIVIIDFDRLLNSKHRHRSMDRIKDCISVQKGEFEISRRYPELNLIELLSKLRGESIIQVEEELEKDIDEVIGLCNYYWKRSLKNKRRENYYTRTSRDSAVCCSEYWDLDREKKANSLKKIQLDKPDSLVMLEQTYERLSLRLKSLRENSSRTNEEQVEMNRLIKYVVSLAEDIKIIKDSRGIPYDIHDVTPRESNTIFVSYVSDMHDMGDSTENENNSGMVTEWQINKIKYMCQEILTPRQFMNFNMYYIQGHSQIEISQSTLRSQQNISQSLLVSIDKIKEFLHD